MQASKKKSRRCCTSIGLFISTLGRSPKYLAAIMPMTFLSSSSPILDCKSPVFSILDLVIANSCCSFTFLLTCERIDFRLLSICCFFFSRSFSRFAAASSFAFCARFSRFFFSASVSGGLPRPRLGGVAKSYHLFIFVSMLSSARAIHQTEQQLPSSFHHAHFSFSHTHRTSGLLVSFIEQ